MAARSRKPGRGQGKPVDAGAVVAEYEARAAELLKSAVPTATKDRAVAQPQPASEGNDR